MERVHFEGTPLGISTHHILGSYPKLMKNVGFHKFISSILSDVEKFAEFNDTIIYTQKNQNKMGTYRQKNLTTFLMKLFGSYPADDARLSRTDARRQYSPLVIFLLLAVIKYMGQTDGQTRWSM